MCPIRSFFWSIFSCIRTESEGYANESFSWIAIRNWSQNPRQLMMSPSNLKSSEFGSFTLTSWIWVVLWEIPWLEICNELNDSGGGPFFKHLLIFANNSKFKSFYTKMSYSSSSESSCGKMSSTFWSISLTLSIFSKITFFNPC